MCVCVCACLTKSPMSCRVVPVRVCVPVYIGVGGLRVMVRVGRSLCLCLPICVPVCIGVGGA